MNIDPYTSGFNHGVATPPTYVLASSSSLPAFNSLGVKKAGILSIRAYESVKRVIDIVFCTVCLVFLFPVLALIALAIKIQDGGPVFYLHTRVGRGGREFRCFKFRSMVRDANNLKIQLAKLNQHPDSKTFKIRKDPRITRVGLLLRRSSLDELPQLFNILLGDMSLVGPRPALPEEVANYTTLDKRRLEVPAGLTCLWQIGGRADLPFDAQVRLDIEYIESRSLTTDFLILLKTIPAVWSGRGAY